MKKIYLLALSVIAGTALMAQGVVPGQGSKLKTTRQNTSRMVPGRVDAIAHGEMRDIILEEDFQTSGAVPGLLPNGWTTNDVTQTQGTTSTGDDTVGPAFSVHTSASANAGGYWPVVEVGTGNRFAGADDDAPPCDCDNNESYLQTPVMDFTTTTNPAATFDIYHDGNFGGGDAWISVSTDNGTTWTMVNYPLDASGFLPVEEGYWQTITFPLYDYTGLASVQVRFVWSDAGQWASGFAVDNVVIGDLPSVSLSMDKVVYGDWLQANFGLGFWDYSQIPLSQVDSVRATCEMTNNGFNTLYNLSMSLEVLKNNVSQGTWNSNPTAASADLASLYTDTLSVVSGYTPDALGTYTLVATASSDSVETNVADNVKSATFQVTDDIYARDLGGAQAFMDVASGDFVGNLFDIYQEETFYSVHVAIGAGSTVGGLIAASIYEFTGFDATTNDPIFTFIEGSETLEAEIFEEHLNSVNGNDFTCLPFADPVTLLAGRVYLVSIQSNTDIRMPVSGANLWPASWIYTDADQTFRWTQGIPMIRLIGDGQDVCTVVVEEINNESIGLQNMPNPASTVTTITYDLQGSSVVSLTVRDITGKLIENVNLGNRPAGRNNYQLNVEGYAPGVYTYTVNNGSANVTRKMIVE